MSSRESERYEDCPPAEIIARVATGFGSPEEESAVSRHLDDCRQCRKRFSDALGPTEEFAALSAENEKAADRELKAIMARGVPRPPDMQVTSDAIVLSGGLRLALPRSADYLARLGPYDVMGVLGQGAMGIVLKAFHEMLDRVIALKVIGPSLARDAAARERFLREARSAAKLKHPNVVVVHDAGVEDGIPYIAMEYVEGKPLSLAIAEEGCLEPHRSVEIAKQILAGLGAAHEAGIIHRDVKPGNVLLEEPSGTVKLADFGLARAVSDALRPTGEGTILGTPAYMSPEQASADMKLDSRSDLFSVGVILFEMLAGSLPFRGHGSREILRKICKEATPDPRGWNPAIPEGLVQIIHRATNKRRDDRYPSAAAFAKHLDDYLQGSAKACRSLAGGFEQCAACGDRLLSQLTVAGKCEICGQVICAACWKAKGIRRCKEHSAPVVQRGPAPAPPATEPKAGEFAPLPSKTVSTSSPEAAAPLVQSEKSATALPVGSEAASGVKQRVEQARAEGRPAVSAADARVSEDTFFRFVENSLETIGEIADPCRQVTFKVPNWAKAAERPKRLLRPERPSAWPAEVQVGGSRPSGAGIVYDLCRRVLGVQQARVVVAVESLANGKRFARDGYDDQPVGRLELEALLNGLARRAREQDTWHLAILFSPTGWMPDARDLVTGKGDRPFRDRFANAVLYQEGTTAFVFDETDERLMPFRDALSTDMDAGLFESASTFVAEYFQLHDSIALDQLQEELQIGRKAALQVARALAATGSYALDMLGDVGMVLSAKR